MTKGKDVKKEIKKGLSLLLAAVLSSCLLTGCGGSEKTASEQGTSGSASGNAEDTLYVFNWSEYIPQEVYSLFEEETGIHVVEATYSSNEEMLAKLIAGNGGQYDLAIASNYVVEAMKEQDLIQPIGSDEIENFSNLDERILDQDYDPGNEYSIPYMGTVTVIAVNKRMCDELGVEIKSLNDLIDPKLENNIVAVDDCREIVGVALKANGFDPDIKDKETIESMSDWLSQLAPNIKLYDSDTAYAAMVTHETAVGIIYNMDAMIAIDEDDNNEIEVVSTEEPCEMSIDSFVLCKGAKHKEAAQEFINFILRPEIYAMCFEEYPALCLNREAVDYLGDISSMPAATLDDEIVNGAHIIGDVGEATTYYDEVFADMKIR